MHKGFLKGVPNKLLKEMLKGMLKELLKDILKEMASPAISGKSSEMGAWLCGLERKGGSSSPKISEIQ